MAKLTILGDAIQIKSEFTTEEIERVKTHMPKALKLYDKNENEIFGIDLGGASISEYGICFCSEDKDGKAFMTTNNPFTDHSNPEEERTFLVKEFAPLLSKLASVEDQITAARGAINEMESSVEASVVFAE